MILPHRTELPALSNLLVRWRPTDSASILDAPEARAEQAISFPRGKAHAALLKSDHKIRRVDFNL